MYLISTQSAVDLICGEPGLQAWVRSVAPDEISVSVVTLGQIEAEVLATGVDEGHDEMDAAYRTFKSLAGRTNNIETFDEEIASVWARLRFIDLPYVTAANHTVQVPDPSRMVIATAIVRKLALIERSQPYHALLRDLMTFDPYR